VTGRRGRRRKRLLMALRKGDDSFLSSIICTIAPSLIETS
jgi:hypothetical protein